MARKKQRRTARATAVFVLLGLLSILLLSCDGGDNGSSDSFNPNPPDDDHLNDDVFDDDFCDDDIASTTTTTTTSTSSTSTSTQATTTTTTTAWPPPTTNEFGYPGDPGMWIDGVFYQQITGGVPDVERESFLITEDDTQYIAGDSGAIIYLYSRQPGENWIREKVSAPGENAAVDVDQNGFIHIAYSNPVDETINYATNRSGEWVAERIDDDPHIYYTAVELDISVDSNGTPHIASSDWYNIGVLYAYKSETDWVIDHVGTDVGMHCRMLSMDVDGNDKIHIFAAIGPSGGTGLDYITNKSGHWTRTFLVGGSYPSIAVGPDDFIHVAFTNGLGAGYANNVSGDWEFEYHGDPAHGCGIVLTIDKIGYAHTAYRECNEWDYSFYATNRSGFWEGQRIYCGGKVNFSIDVDSNGIPYYTSHLAENHELILISPEENVGEQCEVVDRAVSAGPSFDIAIDNNGKPLISFEGRPDRDTNNLYLAERNGAGWKAEIIDDNIAYGSDNSLFVDEYGYAYILYSGGNSNQLYHATNVSGLWERTYLDDYSGGIAQALISKYGNEVVVYPNRPSLIYAVNHNGEWSYESLDIRGGSVGSLLMDDEGYYHLCCRGEGGVNYINNTTGEWTVAFVDGDYIWNCSMALDTEGKVHLAYLTYSYEEPSDPEYLKYATNESGSWAVDELKESTTTDGKYDYRTSIFTDNGNNVFISFENSYFVLNEGDWERSDIIWSIYNISTLDDDGWVHTASNVLGALWYITFPKDYNNAKLPN